MDEEKVRPEGAGEEGGDQGRVFQDSQEGLEGEGREGEVEDEKDQKVYTITAEEKKKLRLHIRAINEQVRQLEDENARLKAERASSSLAALEETNRRQAQLIETLQRDRALLIEQLDFNGGGTAPQLTVERREMAQLREYQRYVVIVGWTKPALPTDPPQYCTVDHKATRKPTTDFPCVSSDPAVVKCHWEGDWEVEKTERTDNDGWEYSATYLIKSWSPKKGFSDFIRRRMWRRYQILTVRTSQ